MEFDLYAVAVVHAVVASWFAYDCFFYSCRNPSENPLSDEKCLMTYGDYEFKIMLNTCGYLVFDFICYKFIVKAKGAIAIQTYLHHILGSIAYYSALYTEGAPIKLGVISLALEVSTIFINLRWFTFEFKMQSGAYTPLFVSSGIFIS